MLTAMQVMTEFLEDPENALDEQEIFIDLNSKQLCSQDRWAVGQ